MANIFALVGLGPDHMNANLLLCTEEWLQNLAIATLKESTIVLLALNHVVYIYSGCLHKISCCQCGGFGAKRLPGRNLSN